ncbi:G-type lectin S-receptor-like serine/threonine-protein kinase At4g27290 [Helianthus annuus]|uniref:G-type lectin S-receptor-like serine/threonine-protein kinase At4g27290 n=1 Tax=Helianthus annuus TaxID=4232 RepID=UPI001652E0F7|nr:G-type lectin S-receptor-like serine/threonine-protein kinase At4g27290 [Helianthus annuus]
MEGAAIALFALLYFHKCYAAELDEISDSRFLTYGDTLVSPTRIFELRFFQPGNSKNTYLGVWNKKISVRTVVWVANRNHPLPGESLLVLKIADQGNLGLYNNISMIWSSNTTTSGNATAKLRDNGNLVVVDQQERVFWQSFDYRGKEWYLTPLDSKNGSEKFTKYSNVKLPDTENTWFSMSMTLEECKTKCLKNCSCMAYANPDPGVRRRGCVLWFNDLLDMRVLPEGRAGPDIFVRMASSESEFPSHSNERQGGANINVININVILVVIIPGVLIGIISTWLCYAHWKRNHPKTTREGKILNASTSLEEEMELPLFSFSTIANATANFLSDNKLGQGGFGAVYKGILEDGQEIAVKRLSKYSSQGLEEFKNEVICISKLQHRNLVKLLGCCIHGDEKLLVYEYMPNKSLDSFIFDIAQSLLLDWTKRVNIIKGIARGLVYLHHDSRLRIIHRDLKASNILLDQDMNPKISDFGLARSFGGNETQANTNRVVGTYGYMSPEYALDGLFSIKSDVFSFGILILEVLSGKRNRGFIDPENENNLVGHVWSLYTEGRSMELIDASCAESCHLPEAIRLINVALLCVQQKAGDRPNMSSVVLMMDSEGEMMQPKKPSFFIEKEFPVGNFSTVAYTGCSLNDMSITEADGR